MTTLSVMPRRIHVKRFIPALLLAGVLTPAVASADPLDVLAAPGTHHLVIVDADTGRTIAELVQAENHSLKVVATVRTSAAVRANAAQTLPFAGAATPLTIEQDNALRAARFMEEFNLYPSP